MPSEKSTASARPAAYASVIRVGRIATSAISPSASGTMPGYRLNSVLPARHLPSSRLVFRHAKVARWDRAVFAHFLCGAEADASARLAVRCGVHQRGRGQYQRRRRRARRRPGRRGVPSHPPESPRPSQDHGEEQAVVDARRQLQRHEQAGQEAVAQRAGVERPLHRPEGPRHPHGPLQLHVHEVREPVRREGEDQAGDDRRGRAAPQIAGEHEHADARGGDDAEEQQVVDEHRRQAGGEQRQRDQRLDHHRVGVGEDAALGVELVAVEEICAGMSAARGAPTPCATD